ncbi:MAG: hypothetical protein Q8K63_00310 [Acidimicrobiales bacterium]|nr:hypothetical protein [Acidimicrobiales bacterium]
MKRRAAVRRTGGVSKKDLLFFDVIHVMGLDDELGSLYSIDPSAAADLEFLANAGIVEPAPSGAIELSDEIRYSLGPELDALVDELISTDDELWPTGDGSHRDMLIEAELLASSGRHPSSAFIHEKLPLGAELLVAFLARLQGEDAVAVFDRVPTPSDWRRLSSGIVIPKSLRGHSGEDHVLEVVLNSLPLPADDVPLEAILDFVSDPDVRSEAEALRLWMRGVAAGTSRSEIELELETRLHQFQRHLRVHRVRSNQGTLRSLISLPLGVAQELVRLRPKSAVDALFVLRERRALKLETRLTAPGHEVAFIDEAIQRFGYR